MKKIDFFNIELSENERKTLTSLITIDKGSPTFIKKSLSEICKETKIRNPKQRSYNEDNTHRGYQYKILGGLIKKGVVKKDDNKKYSIYPIFLDFASSSLIQKKIMDLEKEGLFPFLESTVFGIKDNWLGYPEMNYFHESLVNGLSSLYLIKMIKKIFLLREFSDKWKSFINEDIPLGIKYMIWKSVKVRLSFFNQEKKDNFLEKQADILKSLRVNEGDIGKYILEINKQHKDFIVKFREAIGYQPEKIDDLKEKIIDHSNKYRNEDNKGLNLDDKSVIERITKKLNETQKKQVDHILDWCIHIYPREISNTGFFLDLSNLNDPNIHFKIPIDYEEQLFRKIKDKSDLSRIKSILENVEKNDIDITLTSIFDILYYRNIFRFIFRFDYLFINLIQKPFFHMFYEQLDKNLRDKTINFLRDVYPDSKDKTDYELFYEYAIDNL